MTSTTVIGNWSQWSNLKKTEKIAMFVVSSFLLFVSTATANPVKGLIHCLNNEDCLGANRICHRNTTMTEGLCTCKPGFKSAQANMVKCLDIKKMECESNLDCPGHVPCGQPFAYNFNMEFLIDDFNFSFGDSKKRCIIPFDPFEEPRTGGGLRHRGDFFESFYSLGGHNHRHLGSSSSYHGEYIKFVEDAMLVLFLMCILVTLLVVHRATCRNFWRTRRSGPFRYIIPYRDDQPPSYSQTNVVPEGGNDSSEAGLDEQASAEGGDVTDGKSNRRTETPPPTYDEALLISQQDDSTNSDHDSRVAVNPLFIALPESSPTNSPTVSDETGSDQNSPEVKAISERKDEDPPAYSPPTAGTQN